MNLQKLNDLVRRVDGGEMAEVGFVLAVDSVTFIDGAASCISKQSTNNMRKGTVL